ncbi:MAG: 3-phosphoshikimate 1-carboxyvinyltransferase [Victivallales bacterium]|nr:3-phosphoshikimate 1-carboxyvinyltransferase [Victivallales bacterium]
MSDIPSVISLTNASWQGKTAAPPSKSMAHRLLIAAFLAGADTSCVRFNAVPSEDITATLQCLNALREDTPRLDCGESGSTLRFLVPVAAALGKPASFTGRGRLPLRPMATLLDAMADHGVTADAAALPFTLSGKLQPGEYRLAADISSQYLTGLLLALPLLDAPSRIILTTNLESAGYIDLTLDTLRTFGVTVHREADGFSIPAPQRYRLPEDAGKLTVEGDWSNGAFLLAAGALGSGLTVTGLRRDSLQGDSAMAELLRQFGAEITLTDNTCTVLPGELRGIDIDMRPIPDLAPVLAVVASCAGGTTRLLNAGRLRLKESDRLETTANLINSLGGKAEISGETLTVQGVPALRGGSVDSAGDHRIAMAAAVAALRCAEGVTITGADAVAKSWPDFFQVRRNLTRE